MKRYVLGVLGAALASCLDGGQARISIPLEVAGTAHAEPIAGNGGWSVQLQQAELAFGPLYLCAGYQAGALCETARAEWLETALVDALSPNAVPVGTLEGVSGPVRSWMYDLGISSLLTQQRPLPLAAAQSLGGNSVRLAGVASLAEQVVPFAIELRVQQDEQTEIGASVVRKSGSDVFEHELRGDEASLTVRFTPATWVQGIDFAALAASGNGAAAAALAPDDQALRAVRAALVAGERPEFEWNEAP